MGAKALLFLAALAVAGCGSSTTKAVPTLQDFAGDHDFREALQSVGNDTTMIGGSSHDLDAVVVICAQAVHDADHLLSTVAKYAAHVPAAQEVQLAGREYVLGFTACTQRDWDTASDHMTLATAHIKVANAKLDGA